VTFDSEDSCRNAKQVLESTSIRDYHLSPIKTQGMKKSIRITPPLSEDAIERDLEMCEKLVGEVLNPEKGIA
jgi:hypothetical protein